MPDEATKRFERGMEQYRKADYAGAVDGLRAAAELDPDGVHILFFLGVSHLMLGHDDAAIERLRATIARRRLGVSRGGALVPGEGVSPSEGLRRC